MTDARLASGLLEVAYKNNAPDIRLGSELLEVAYAANPPDTRLGSVLLEVAVGPLVVSTQRRGWGIIRS